MSDMQLHLQQVPVGHGRLWIRHGFKVFRRQPLVFSGLFGMMLLASTLLSSLPAIGLTLGLMTMPLCSLGFMLATHLVLQRKMPNVGVFVAPLRLTPQRRNQQLILCGSFALLAVGLLVVSDWIDGDVTRELMALMRSDAGAGTDKVAPLATDPRLLWGTLLRTGGFALLSVPYWHAPALVHWGGQSAPQALFSSTMALWRNKAAFALNALLWFALVLGLSAGISLLFGLLGLMQIAPAVMLVGLLVLASAFYASLYFSFVDCFMFGAPQSLLDEPPEGKAG
jgi:hypothetical protein